MGGRTYQIEAPLHLIPRSALDEPIVEAATEKWCEKGNGITSMPHTVQYGYWPCCQVSTAKAEVVSGTHKGHCCCSERLKSHSNSDESPSGGQGGAIEAFVWQLTVARGE